MSIRVVRSEGARLLQETISFSCTFDAEYASLLQTSTHYSAGPTQETENPEIPTRTRGYISYRISPDVNLVAMQGIATDQNERSYIH